MKPNSRNQLQSRLAAEKEMKLHPEQLAHRWRHTSLDDSSHEPDSSSSHEPPVAVTAQNPVAATRTCDIAGLAAHIGLARIPVRRIDRFAAGSPVGNSLAQTACVPEDVFMGPAGGGQRRCPVSGER
jgi:hypothetical protein